MPIIELTASLMMILSQGSSIGDDSQPPRPNIIFIFTDDHCTQALGAYGSRMNTTPNLDRIATEGMRFDNCFVTNGICAPSRAVVLTGLHSHLNGQRVNGPAFDGAQVTLPKLLRESGYQTAIVGKWHLRSAPTGFDHHDVLIGQGPYYNPTMIRNGTRHAHVGYTTDIITDKAIEFMSRRDTDRPFMLMYQHKAPHRNWQPGPDHLDMYADETMPEPDTLLDDYSGRGSASTRQTMTIARDLSRHDLKLDPPRNLTEEQLERWNAAYGPRNELFEQRQLEGEDLVRWKYQRYVKDYLRCVASVDDNIGRILDYLDQEGLSGNTVVIYSSDQGWYLGEHGWYDKRWMYEESLRTPLLVRWPGVVDPGSSSDDLCQNLDFAPTILDMAGLEPPASMQGESLVPILEGDSPDDWRDSIYYHYYENPGAHTVPRHEGVRNSRYKLIHFYRIGEWELYDLDRDPDEMRNVHGDPAYSDVLVEMKLELQRLRQFYRLPPLADDDPFPQLDEEAKSPRSRQTLEQDQR